MREMKDSGIAWVKTIPAHWEIKRGKFALSLLDRPVFPDDQVITCFRDGQVTLRANRREEGFTVSMQEAGYQGIEPGDLVVHGMDGFAGAIGVSDSRGKGTPVLNVLDSKYNKRFLMYYLRMIAFIGVFESLSTGIRVRSCDTNWNKLRELPYFLPPSEEQNKIVAYLDNATRDNKELALQIQKQIDTLEGIKQSIISEAVTKGLNRQAELRESGIKWVSHLPAHWAIIPSKYLFRDSDVRKQAGDVQLTASQKYGIISQEEYMERENAKVVLANQGLDDWKHVEPYDFVISLRSFQGGLEMSETTGCITWHYVVLKATKPIYPKFYKWLFKSSMYITAIQRTCNFIRDGQDLRYSNFSQVPLYEPPLEEQKEIADYLDKKCAEIDTIIASKQKQLETLDAYKKSLIFEYVTGKKEVL